MKRKFNYNKEMIKDNIEGVLQQAPLSIYVQAKDWYPNAHRYAEELSKDFSLPIEVTSALIACLSPQKEWFHNLELTKEFINSGGRRCRHTTQQVSKAKLIYLWTSAYPDGMSFIERMLGGPKTINFFRNIYDPTDRKYVTIDSHMAQLMSGNFSYVDPTLKQYHFLKDCVIEVAETEGLIPQELQSVLWLTWKQVKSKKMTLVEEMEDPF